MISPPQVTQNRLLIKSLLSKTKPLVTSLDRIDSGSFPQETGRVERPQEKANSFCAETGLSKNPGILAAASASQGTKFFGDGLIDFQFIQIPALNIFRTVKGRELLDFFQGRNDFLLVLFKGFLFRFKDLLHNFFWCSFREGKGIIAADGDRIPQLLQSWNLLHPGEPLRFGYGNHFQASRSGKPPRAGGAG